MDEEMLIREIFGDDDISGAETADEGAEMQIKVPCEIANGEQSVLPLSSDTSCTPDERTEPQIKVSHEITNGRVQALPAGKQSALPTKSNAVNFAANERTEPQIKVSHEITNEKQSALPTPTGVRHKAVTDDTDRLRRAFGII